MHDESMARSKNALHKKTPAHSRTSCLHIFTLLQCLVSPPAEGGYRRCCFCFFFLRLRDGLGSDV